MAVVRPYPISEVQGAVLPNVQPGVDQGALALASGAPAARDMVQAGQTVDRAAAIVDNMAEREFKIANDTRVQDLNNQYITGAQQILHTGPDAFSKLKGEEAIKAAPAVTERLGKLREQLLGTASNDYQRRSLRTILDAQVNSSAETINKRVEREQEVYDKRVALTAIDTSATEAITNPDNLGPAVMRAEGAARSLFKGQAPEVIEAEARKAGSHVISSLIKDRIVRNDPSAVGLFRQYESRLDAGDRLGLAASIETLSNTVAASDWVRARTAGPTGEQAKAGTKTSMSFWTGDGYSAPVAAGITAGFLRESQFDARALNPKDGRDGSDSINIGQWNGTRARAFADFAAANKLDPRDPRTGLAYAKAEVDGVIPYSVSGLSPEFKAKLQAAKTEKEAADIMTRGYFRPRHTEGESAIRQGSASAILAEHGVPATTGDPALDAVNAATGATPAPGVGRPPAAVLSQEGVVDYRRQMIDLEQRRIALTAQNESEFVNDPVRMRANQAAIEAAFTRGKATVQAGKDLLYANLQDWMTKGGPNGGPAVTMPPATIMSQLTYEQQNSVERQINRNVEGKKTKTNMEVWYGLHAGLASGNANERELWASTNLMQFKEHLSDQDFQELAKLQAAVRKGDGKEITHAQTIGQMVNSTLLQMGIDPTPKPDTSPTSDAAKAARFHRVFQNELTVFEENKGKTATPQEVQGIIDGLVKTGAKSGWFNQTDVPVFMIGPADVPAADREQIIAAIRKAGGVPTEERVVDVYRHKLASDPRQTEIARPAPTANVRGGVEPIGVGTGGMGAGVAPTPAAVARQPGPFPTPNLPARATPRVIGNPSVPYDYGRATGPPSTPEEERRSLSGALLGVSNNLRGLLVESQLPDNSLDLPQSVSTEEFGVGRAGMMSSPIIRGDQDQHDDTVRSMRLRLGLEVH